VRDRAGALLVPEAANGREVIDLVRSRSVDVALLDIQMPVMDGLLTLGELRRTAPAARVIVLTTFGERGNVLRALKHGGVGFLLKDTASAELIRAAARGDACLSPGCDPACSGPAGFGRAAARG
jgi:DNA-binding NarL/FixJ family response regulator